MKKNKKNSIDDETKFKQRNFHNITQASSDANLKNFSTSWMLSSVKYEYSYHFSWLGLPIIQYPQDIIAIQELIWKIKPDLIIETGIARGGSLIFYTSMMKLLNNNGTVIGIDIDIREHNKVLIEQHPLYNDNDIIMLEGSSTDSSIIKKVARVASSKKTILVILDSNHTHQHVLKELELYSPFVSKNSYLIVLDTIVEQFPNSLVENRPWSKGNNPHTAVQTFLKNNNNFEIDQTIDAKLLISVAPKGYLKKVK